jgi:hypothetical protein
MPAPGIEFKGGKEADEKFRRLGLLLDSQQVTNIVYRGAQIVRSGVERFAPKGIDSKKPGTLKKGVMALPMGRKSNKPAGALVLVNYSPRRGVVAPHGHLVESGTKPHLIAGKHGKMLVLFGGRVIRRSVHHPGAKPQPFFATGVSTTRTPARNFVRDEIAKLIETAAQKN